MSIVSLTQSNNNTQDNIFYNINQVPLYKPRKCILKTTNGALYLAQNMQNKEECIIKQSQPTNDGISHVLLKEITLLNNMNHEHVIKMKEIFLTPEHNTCIVFPKFKQNLTEFIKEYRNKNQQIQQDLIKKWSYQMIAALSHIHSKRMTHQHINCQNIIITNILELNIKIGYFELNNNEPVNAVSSLSPQLISGVNRTTNKDDVWSLGCVIAEIARDGCVLFKGSSNPEILRSISQILPALNNDHWRKSFVDCKSIPFESALGKLKNNNIACDLLKVKLCYILYHNTNKHSVFVF